jgi:hypothetical protein
LLSELADYFCIAVRAQKRHREWQPLPVRHRSHHVEQENKQIVRLSRESRQRFFVNDFEINQTCAVAARIVDHILAGAIAVRPAATEFVTPKSVGATKLSRRGDQHSSRQRPAIQVFP